MTAGQEKRLKAKIRKQWDIPALVSELCNETWRRTEPNRFDRMSGIGSYQSITEMARDVFPAKEWKDAAKEGFEHELVDDYLETLAGIVSEKGICVIVAIPSGVKEWRPSPENSRPIGHVYATYEDGECYLGQYEDGTAEELREMGYKVEE